jgi:4'-phosphopantetheinyl transferase EntD
VRVAFACAFRLDLPHGRCVGVEISPHAPPPDQLAALDPQERAFLATLPPARQPSFAAGRTALRAALGDLGLPLAPLLPGPRGAPRLPPGALGSISHKQHLAVALAASTPAAPVATPLAPADCALGVDLEEERPFRIDISRRVLTPGEREALRSLPEPERTAALRDRFCLKEAFYKAANIFVPRTISFQEVAVAAVGADGRARFEGSFLDAHPLLADGWVGRPHPGYRIASVSVCRRP